MAACPCPVTVVSAGKVYGSFDPLVTGEAFVSVCGRVIRLGSRGEALEGAGRLARLLGCGEPVELEYGGVVVPGFVDAHLHLAALGFESGGLDLRGASSLEELLEAVARAPGMGGGWVYGRGWDQELMGAWPTRYDLDEAAPGRPVLLMRVCGHVAVASTEALRRLGLLGPRAAAVKGVDLGCDGEPTGLLYEEAAWEAYRAARREAMPALEAVLRAQELLLGRGVTGVAAMDVGAWELAGLLEAWRRGLLRIRVRAYLSWRLFEQLEGLAPGLGGLGDETLRIAGVKLYADGSLGAGTAFLREPYSDNPGSRGLRLLGAGELAWRARRIAGAGLDVAVHAIGDAALDEVVRGFGAAGVAGRVEHASLAPPGLVEALAGLGLRVAAQPRFLVSDWWAVERLGADRARWLYPFRSMLRHGVRLGFSSDAPVEPPDPLEGVEAAATRGRLRGVSSGEALTVREALHLYTRGSATVIREPRLGCLLPGCYADAAVLSVDPLEAPAESVAGARVEAVLVGGAEAWRRTGRPARPSLGRAARP